MKRFLAAMALVLVASQFIPTGLAAQQRSAVSSAELRSAVTHAPSDNRAVMQEFLQNDQVIRTAERMGLTSSDLAVKVGQLDDATLNQVADRTRAADLDLVGGKDYVIISTTAIIIILLILILVT